MSDQSDEKEVSVRQEGSNPEQEDLLKSLKKLSGGKPERIAEITETLMMTGSFPNPLQRKLNETHITQVIDLALKHDERQYELRITANQNGFQGSISQRRYLFAGFLCLIGLIVLILFLFKDQPNTLIPVLTGLGGFFTGAAGGFGFGKSLK